MRKIMSCFLAVLLMIFPNLSHAQTEKDILSEIDECYRTRDFSGMISICENAKPSYASTQKILELAIEGAEVYANCEASTDPVTKAKYIEYKGLDTSYEDISIYPYYKDVTLHFTVGFVADSWVFFDHVYIASDNPDFDSISFYFGGDTSHKVLSNGNVLERGDRSSIILEKDELDTLKSSGNFFIRFLNYSTDEYIDRPLSQTEVDSLYTFGMLEYIHREYQEIFYEYYYK